MELQELGHWLGQDDPDHELPIRLLGMHQDEPILSSLDSLDSLDSIDSLDSLDSPSSLTFFIGTYGFQEKIRIFVMFPYDW